MRFYAGAPLIASGGPILGTIMGGQLAAAPSESRAGGCAARLSAEGYESSGIQTQENGGKDSTVKSLF